MKKIILILLTLLIVACTQQVTSTATPNQQPTLMVSGKELATATLTEALTNTSIPTFTSTPALTVTPQPPATCPEVNQKLRIPLGPVFKDKSALYHDVRTLTTNFLNEGGDPKTLVDKLAENNIHANLFDVTHDGVPELILPSGYLTVWGCQDGKYAILLDIAPSDSNATAIPLVIQDINQNGLLEILIGQIEGKNSAAYQILEWNGSQFAGLAPADEILTNFVIQNQIIHTTGQSNAERGAIDGNWEVIDLDRDGHKEIVLRAGVYLTSSLESTLTLKWDGNSYVVSDFAQESTPTPSPTLTPLPFSATCAIKVPELRFQKPHFDEAEKTITDFLNAGGQLEQLQNYYKTIIKDLNNDSAPEIIVVDWQASMPYAMMFTCQDGKYIRNADYPHGIGVTQRIMEIKDNNRNGFPEIFIEEIGCLSIACGTLYVIEWDGNDFIQRIAETDYSGKTVGYADMSAPNDAYLKDLDGDGIDELVWTGELYPDWHSGYWTFYPQRLATHTFKWDGTNYAAQPIEYAAPKYRFQAIQDGDIYSKSGQYEKALQSYKLAMRSDSLDWWTKELHDYIMASHGIGPCAENATACFAEEDPKERPILSAYALYKTMIVHLLMNNTQDAQATYTKILSDHPTGTPGYEITQMAIKFWDEYQYSQSISMACAQSVTYSKVHPNMLNYLSGSELDFQGISYHSDPVEVCPFK